MTMLPQSDLATGEPQLQSSRHQRKHVNVILPGQVYQRGQILSWSREDKLALLREYNIRVVVNFWPKLDPDFSGDVLDLYMYAPNSRSLGMLGNGNNVLAAAGSHYLKSKPGSAALILCEAGKTRSVFFCVLLLCNLLGVQLKEALAIVEQAVPNHSLKQFMLDYIQNGVYRAEDLGLAEIYP